MYEFIEYWFIAFWVIWIIFANVIQYKDKITSMAYPQKLVVGLLFIIGYIGDIIWNLIPGTIIFYCLDLIDDIPKENRQGIPSFKGVTIRTSYKLTLSKRLQRIVDSYPESTYNYRFTVWLAKYLINPFDPGHITLNETMKQFEA